MITFKDINLTFDNQSFFKDFNLTVNKGEKLLLNGKSGSGKSSLMKLLLGFLKPDSGNIYLHNQVLTSASLHTFRRQISYVSQDVDLYDGIIGDTIHAISLFNVNKACDFSQDRLHTLLELFLLNQNILKKKTSELSGGERERIGFIINILLDRDIWILDEVTSGLDDSSKRIVADYIGNSHKTIFIISHDAIFLEYKQIKVVRW